MTTSRYILALFAAFAFALAVDLIAQPANNALSTLVKLDASGYLITTAAAYTGPDGPARNFANQQLKVDSNGYLLTTFNGPQTIATVNLSPSVLFAALGTVVNGAMKYCSDCTVTTAATCPATSASCVCAGSGTGALAVGLNSAWDCTVHH